MDNSGIFVFGIALWDERKRDSISALPLEMSWKIFSYLDDASLRNATRVGPVWRKIILSNKELKNRLNIFETVLMFGSRSIIKYIKNGKRRLKNKAKNYLTLGETAVKTTKMIFKNKRGGDDLILYTKRYKLC
ncbi:PREDICTED: cell division control protein 4-like [Papilio xuthus]|uniref:Cell division control protein 4-like n=1 Tax=Papilio xuthus TaxID=66420 RepID=A0AAJ6ZCK8_PAPXU|nr:PREDICTED: cell division control protein 4-like [Papilio xuthus]